MKKTIGCTTVAMILCLIAVTGCDEDSAFYIYQNQVPKAGCIVTVDTEIYRAQGLLDVSLGVGYVLYPLIRNDLPVKKATGSKSERPEPNLLHLKEFRVQLDLGQVTSRYANDLLRFSRPTSGTLLPGGKRASSVEVIPSDLVKQIEVPEGARPMIMAEVKAVAEDGDGDVLESIPFFYPISLCDGCLVVMLDACSSSTNIKSNVCGLPQDGPLVCCNDPDSGLLCSAGQ
jgi:hypothetical protein